MLEIGEAIGDLELIARVTEPEELLNAVREWPWGEMDVDQPLNL